MKQEISSKISSKINDDFNINAESKYKEFRKNLFKKQQETQITKMKCKKIMRISPSVESIELRTKLL